MNWEVRAMRSATSYFDPTLYRKTMSRFWPLWAGWGLLLLLGLPLNLLRCYLMPWGTESPLAVLSTMAFYDLPGLLQADVWLMLPLAVLCAMAVFSYLFSSRSACMMHALPLRRENLFCTQYLAGLSMLILPALAAGILSGAIELVLLPSEHWGRALSLLGLTFLGHCAVVLFFFSFAAFCAMFTGHILALPVFYGVLNFLAAAVSALVESLLGLFFVGFDHLPDGNLSLYLSPFFTLQDAASFRDFYENGVRQGAGFRSLPTLWAYAGVGLVLAAAALLVYRRRHTESAGDVVAVPLVRPLFKLGVSVCAGLFLGSFTTEILGLYDERAALCILVVIWTVIGWYAAEMLLQKSFRVFRSGLRGAAVMGAIAAVLCASCYFDWYGVEKHVPDPGSVAGLSVNMEMGCPYDSGSHLNLPDVTDPALVEDFVSLHRDLVQDISALKPASRSSWRGRPYDGGPFGYLGLGLCYRLENGRTLTRRYRIPLRYEDVDREGTPTFRLQQFIGNRELAAAAYGFEEVRGRTLYRVELQSVLEKDTGDMISASLSDLSGLQRQELWKAVLTDFREGTIGRRWILDDLPGHRENTYITDLVFSFDMPVSEGGIPDTYCTTPGPGADLCMATRDVSVTLTPGASNTLRVLEECGALDDLELCPWGWEPAVKGPDWKD